VLHKADKWSSSIRTIDLVQDICHAAIRIMLSFSRFNLCKVSAFQVRFSYAPVPLIDLACSKGQSKIPLLSLTAHFDSALHWLNYIGCLHSAHTKCFLN